MDFNPAASTIMHVDINSCFATIEQQANPFLRDKFVAVGAYTTDSGCILAASYSAKRLGVKTGMRVKEARALCPSLIALPPDPSKYRFVHKILKKILESYSPIVVPKSIDEFVVDFSSMSARQNCEAVGREIKSRIKSEIGEFITVSIGIAPNRYLAKTAAGYKKPDGLFEISGACGPSGVNKNNYLEVFASLKLTDLCGIKYANAARLSKVGIYTVLDLYNADIQKLKSGFHSVNGYYWYMRLHGYEVDSADFTRKSFGNSYALPKPYSTFKEISPILTKLIEKMARRLRRKKYVAEGVHVGILFRDNLYWHKGKKLHNAIWATSDFKREIFNLLFNNLNMKPVRNLSVSCFNLKLKNSLQLDMTCDVIKKENLTKALDTINNKYGEFTITPARMINKEDYVHDRIAFGIID